jgi:hypothetical protein
MTHSRLTLRLLVLLPLVVFLLAANAKIASAGPRTTPLTFTPGGMDGGRHIAQPVDWLTQCGDCVSTNYLTVFPWVSNPTQCMWDTDDSFEYMSSGTSLAAGGSASVNDCSYESTAYGDPNVFQTSVIHAAYLDVTAPSPGLRVTETLSWTGGSDTFAPSASWNAATKRYEYRACIVINSVANGTWALVPGSNGGWGVPVAINATVANPTSRSVASIGGTVQYGWQEYYAAGCQMPSPFPAPLH